MVWTAFRVDVPLEEGRPAAWARLERERVAGDVGVGAGAARERGRERGRRRRREGRGWEGISNDLVGESCEMEGEEEWRLRMTSLRRWKDGRIDE